MYWAELCCSESFGDRALSVASESFGDRAFSVAGLKLWNQLPLSIRQSSSVGTFTKELKTHLFKLAYV